jgi:O-antigen/teichoic acid export membrane protein
LFGWSHLAPVFSMEVVRRNIGFTGHMMVISVLSLVHTQAAQVIVSKLLPIAEFGFYGFASSTVTRATFVTGAAAQAAFPSFTSLFASGDQPGLLRQYRKMHDLVCYGTLPLLTGLCFAALPVYTYVFNAGVAQRLLLPTGFLALGTWMNATINMPYVLSLAMGRPQIAARLNLYALIAVLPVTAGLILVYGLPGAGFSWVFYHLFAYAYLVPRISRECLRSPILAWYIHVLKVVGLAAVTYGLAWLVINSLQAFSLPALFAAYAAATVAFGVGAYVSIGPDLRDTIRGLRGTLMVRNASAL